MSGTYVESALKQQIDAEISKEVQKEAEERREKERQITLELTYGKNKHYRTARQWTRLVDRFGIENVANNEELAVSEVVEKCKLTMKQRIELQNRENRKRK